MTVLATSFKQDVAANKSVAATGNAGRYYETDTKMLRQSTESTWTLLAINTPFVASGTNHVAGLVPDPGAD